MLLKNGSVILDKKFVPADDLIKDGKISAVWEYPEKTGRSYPEEEIIDCAGNMIWPGLFDLQKHGCIRYDFTKSSPDEILKMCLFYSAQGVYYVLETTMT